MKRLAAIRIVIIAAVSVLVTFGFAVALTLASLRPAPAVISAPPAANVDVNWITLTDTATTGTGTELQCGGATQIVVEYEIATGTTAGVVVLEHSATSGYSGTWAQLDSETVGAGLPTAPSKQIFTYPGPLGFIRPRITTTFSGGGAPSVSVRAKRMFGQ